jgi:hypothetical protein
MGGGRWGMAKKTPSTATTDALSTPDFEGGALPTMTTEGEGTGSGDPGTLGGDPGTLGAPEAVRTAIKPGVRRISLAEARAHHSRA